MIPSLLRYYAIRKKRGLLRTCQRRYSLILLLVGKFYELSQFGMTMAYQPQSALNPSLFEQNKISVPENLETNENYHRLWLWFTGSPKKYFDDVVIETTKQLHQQGLDIHGRYEEFFGTASEFRVLLFIPSTTDPEDEYRLVKPFERALAVVGGELDHWGRVRKWFTIDIFRQRFRNGSQHFHSSHRAKNRRRSQLKIGLEGMSIVD